MIEEMESDALEKAYQAALQAAKILGAERRRRRQMFDRIMDAVRGEPCSAYQFTAQRHCGGIATDGDEPPSRAL